MAIIFPTNTISEVNSAYITYPGTLVQQVEQRITATLDINVANSWTQLGQASITPTSATSTILIYYHTSFRHDVAQGNWSLGQLSIFHVNSGNYLSWSGWNGTWRHVIGHYSKSHLHSPGTTATQTYSLRHLSHNTGAVFWANKNIAHDGLSFIRLMEFAA